MESGGEGRTWAGRAELWSGVVTPATIPAAAIPAVCVRARRVSPELFFRFTGLGLGIIGRESSTKERISSRLPRIREGRQGDLHHPAIHAWSAAVSARRFRSG